MKYIEIATGKSVEVEHLKEFPAWRGGFYVHEQTPYFIINEGMNYAVSAATFAEKYKVVSPLGDKPKKFNEPD